MDQHMERAQRVRVLAGMVVPVYCGVVQRSADLGRQIAVGCRSADHSDPEQFPGVLQGRQRQIDSWGQQVAIGT